MMEIKDELKDLHEWRLSELQSIEDTFNDKFADIMQKLKSKAEKKPVVPWVGAFMYHAHNDEYFYWTANKANPHIFEIVDAPLHPQFMPNDGVNPWPYDMEVQIVLTDQCIMRAIAGACNWGKFSHIIGSRPACGWAEYLKERNNG